MRRVKRLTALLMASTLVFSLTACGSSSSDSTDAADDTSAAAEEATEDTSAEAETEEAALYEQAAGNTYVIGTDTTFAPFEFENDEGEHTGIDIELFEAIADEMGFTIEWQILGFSASVALCLVTGNEKFCSIFVDFIGILLSATSHNPLVSLPEDYVSC